MFDTIKLDVKLYLSPDEIDSIIWIKTDTNQFHDYNSRKTVFKTYGAQEGMPRLRYRYKEDNPSVSTLKVELSIPKFLYGNNVSELKEADIPLFFSRLRAYIADVLMIPLERVPEIDMVEVEKLHICYNFRVDDNVRHYLVALSSVSRAKYRTNVLGNGTTVEWRSVTRKEKIYDKEWEILCAAKASRKRVNQQLLNEAKGILRYEIELSDKELRRQSSGRIAGELLDFQYARGVLQKGIEEIGLNNNVRSSNLKLLLSVICSTPNITLQNKHNLISFLVLLANFGDDYCRRHYSQPTYYRMRSDMQNYLGIKQLVLSEVYLPSLVIVPQPTLVDKCFLMHNSYPVLETRNISKQLQPTIESSTYRTESARYEEWQLNPMKLIEKLTIQKPFIKQCELYDEILARVVGI